MKKQAISLLSIFLVFIFHSYAQVSERTISYLLDDSAVKQGHAGVSVFDVATNKYIYNYQADKFFIPASNQKIFTLYAGLKYLGDSLVTATIYQTKDYCIVVPNGDPSFLNPEFNYQPLLNILKNTDKQIVVLDDNWQDSPLGKGWMWDDYADEFSAERSAMPVFKNVASIGGSNKNPSVSPAYFLGEVNWNADRKYFQTTSQSHRDLYSNRFYTNSGSVGVQAFPFLTMNGKTNVEILNDVLKKDIQYNTMALPKNIPADSILQIKSIPAMDLYTPMMHKSDNFFAEQTLLMASNTALGKMNDHAIADRILSTDFRDIPQQPQWIDGSGLSRYNLCTPQSLVYALNKLQQEFGMEKMKEIFPTGGEGTISNYYQEIRGKIFAKTGTMSDNSAFSGYLISKQNKLLIFSVMVNNYQKGGRSIRLAIEKFLLGVWREN